MYVSNMLYCVDVNLICIAVLVVVKMYTGYSKIKSFAGNSILSKITYASIFFCVYDLALYFLSKFVITDSHPFVLVCDVFYLVFYVAICYLCFIFAVSELQIMKLNRKNLLLIATPGIVSVVAATVAVIICVMSSNISYIKYLLLCCGLILTGYYIIVFVLQFFYFVLKKKMRISLKDISFTVLYFFLVFLSILVQWMFFTFYLPQIFFTFFALFGFMTLQNVQRVYDSLTGTLNRRGLDERILYYSDNPPKDPVFVMMLDINDFKKINDTFGHTVGDSALGNAAEILKTTVSKFAQKPFLYRYGGDEFLIIAENFTLVNIKRMKEMIDSESEKINIERENPYFLTFSTGVAYAKIKDGSDLYNLIHIADEAMYKEKNKIKSLS